VIAPENVPVRILLTVPFAALVVSGGALVAASINSLGVANDVGYGEWVPMAGGVILALPLLAGGLFWGARVWQRISRPYRLYLTRLLPAWGFILAVAGLGVAYILTIDNPETYQGNFNTLTQRYEPNLTVESFYILSVGLSAFLLGALYLAMRFLYLTGVERQGLSVPEGVDPIGSLINERRTHI